MDLFSCLVKLAEFLRVWYKTVDVTECERAWAAGFFDGEGCTIVWPKTPKQRSNRSATDYPSLRISIGQKESETLNRFRMAVGYGNVSGPHRMSTGQKFAYQANGHDVVEVLRMIGPWLSSSKRKQARLAIDIVNGYLEARTAKGNSKAILEEIEL